MKRYLAYDDYLREATVAGAIPMSRESYERCYPPPEPTAPEQGAGDVDGAGIKWSDETVIETQRQDIGYLEQAIADLEAENKALKQAQRERENLETCIRSISSAFFRFAAHQPSEALSEAWTAWHPGFNDYHELGDAILMGVEALKAADALGKG